MFPFYQPPTSQELRELLSRWGISQGMAARIINVSDGTVRLYVSPKRTALMTYPQLYVLAAECQGIAITQGNWRTELDIL